MADNNNTQVEQQPPKPDSALKSLNVLVGTWKVSGGTPGRVAYESAMTRIK